MERLKFYADNKELNQVNKLFVFNISGILDLGNVLLRFSSRVNYIRAAWYEFVNTDTGEIENRRIDLIYFYECLNDKSYTETIDLIKFID